MMYYTNNIVGTCNLIECMRSSSTCKKVQAFLASSPQTPTWLPLRPVPFTDRFLQQRNCVR